MRDLYSMEAEHGVLGALMLDADLFDQITTRVSCADFSDIENAALYQAIIDCREKGNPIDPVTVGVNRPYLPGGGSTIAYAGEIAKNVPSAANWKAYVRVVLERAALRRVMDAAEVIRDMAQEDRPVADIIAMAQQATADLRDLNDGAPDYYRVSDILPGVIDTVDAKFNKTAKKGLSTGLPALDELLHGLRPGNMIVIAGLPGSGKTTLGVQIAQHVTCQAGGAGLVFSLEMTKEELVTRGIASIGGVSLTRLDEGNLTDDDWPRVTAAVHQMNEARLYANDEAGMTAARIRSIARYCQRKEGLDVLVVDYITLIAGEGGQNRTIEVGRISTALKNLAKELMVPVIVLAQLNRGSTSRPDKRPRPSDLRDSGQIEQDADVVVLVHRDADTEQGRNGVTELIVGKIRHGKQGSCLVQQEGQFVRFIPFAGTAPTNEDVEMARPFAGRSKGRKTA